MRCAAYSLLAFVLFGCTTPPASVPTKKVYIIEDIQAIKMGPLQCGPTSLAMVLNYHGVEANKDEVDRSVRQRRGSQYTSPFWLAEYARQQGFKAHVEGLKLEELRQLVSAGLPIVVFGRVYRGPFKGSGHFQVVFGYSEKDIYRIDPARGEREKVEYNLFRKFWDRQHWDDIPRRWGHIPDRCAIIVRPK